MKQIVWEGTLIRVNPIYIQFQHVDPLIHSLKHYSWKEWLKLMYMDKELSLFKLKNENSQDPKSNQLLMDVSMLDRHVIQSTHFV